MKEMFQLCNELKYLDLSNFNTSNVIDMESMFQKCRSLKEIKGINNFNTINVNNMKQMFQECNELKYLDLSKFNTSKVTNMSEMFSDCYELEYLDLSNFNTSNVTEMNNMFSKCYQLQEIKGINKFNVSKVINMKEMFEECNIINIIDLNKFNNLNNNNEIIMEQPQNNEIKRKEDINEEDLIKIMDDELNAISKQSITIYFTSTDQVINYSITCFSSDLFSTIVQKLFLQFPILKNKKMYFMANGRIINKLSTLEQNKLINNNHILIIINDS